MPWRQSIIFDDSLGQTWRVDDVHEASLDLSHHNRTYDEDHLVRLPREHPLAAFREKLVVLQPNGHVRLRVEPGVRSSAHLALQAWVNLLSPRWPNGKQCYTAAATAGEAKHLQVRHLCLAPTSCIAFVCVTPAPVRTYWRGSKEPLVANAVIPAPAFLGDGAMSLRGVAGPHRAIELLVDEAVLASSHGLHRY